MDDQPQRETRTFRSSIKSELLSRTIKTGGIVGGAGALVLLLGGTLLPLAQLKFWGIPILLVGFTLIAIGLLPYRRLVRLQIHPHLLIYDGTTLIFCKRGQPLLQVFEASIEKIRYEENAHLYGIAIWLKQPVVNKVKVLDSHFDFASFTAHSAHHFQGCDLFLPYFSKRCVQEICELMRQD